MADAGARAPHGASASCARWRATGRRPRSSSARTSRTPRRRCSRRPSGAGCGSRAASSSPTATCAPTSRSRPRRAYDGQPRAARPLARPRPPALRRHAALLGVLQRADARRLPRAARRGAGVLFTSHINESPGEIDFVRELFPRGARLPRHLRARRAAAASARCSPTTSTSPTTSWAGSRRHGRAVAHCPSSQRLPGLGHLPDGAPRRARRALRDGHRRRRRAPGLSMLKEGLVAYHVQMVRDQGHMLGPGAPAVAGDRGGRRRARPRRRRAATCAPGKAADFVLLRAARRVDAGGRARGGAGLERGARRAVHAGAGGDAWSRPAWAARSCSRGERRRRARDARRARAASSHVTLDEDEVVPVDGLFDRAREHRRALGRLQPHDAPQLARGVVRDPLADGVAVDADVDRVAGLEARRRRRRSRPAAATCRRRAAPARRRRRPTTRPCDGLA